MNETQINLLKALIVVGVAVTMVFNPLMDQYWSDSSKYIDMANGLPSFEPWSSRPLIPSLVRLMAYVLPFDVVHIFQYLNILFFALAGLLLLREYDLTAALVTMACLSPAITIFGAVLLDSAIFFWFAMALFLRERPYILFGWSIAAAAVHPMAFVLCWVILLFSAQGAFSNLFLVNLLYVLMPLVVYLIFFLPIGTYTTFLLPEFKDLLYSLRTLNVLWFGLFFLRKDRESLLVVVVVSICVGFAFFLTMPARAFTPLALMLGPILVDRMREKEREQ